MKYLNERPKTSILRRKHGGNLHDSGFGHDFFVCNTKGKKKDEFYLLHQIKNFCPSNDTIRRVKRQPAEKRSICESCI